MPPPRAKKNTGRSPKAPRPPRAVAQKPQASRRRKSAAVAVKKGAVLSQHEPAHGAIPGVMKRGANPQVLSQR
jgi:hypothetical protein